MAQENYVVYIRVSTKRQGDSGLGLEAQKDICEKYIKEQKGESVYTFKDVESGTHRDRPGLWQAIEFCKANRCCLVVAKLDRLARDVEFIFKVVNSGIKIHFCDMPMVNTMILGVFASVAQYERELISKRTKGALAAKRARGEHLGRPKGTSLEEANQASSIARRQRALNNPTNKTIWEVVRIHTKDFTEVHKANFEEAVKTLNKMGVKTTSGMDMNIDRIRSAYYNIKRMQVGFDKKEERREE